MRSLSFRDLMFIPALAKIPEAELISPRFDKMLLPIFREWGFDTKKPISYFAAKHKDLQGTVGVGFIAAGELNRKAHWYINHPVCHPIEKMMASNSMAAIEFISKLLSQSKSPITSRHPYPPTSYEADYLEVSEEIARLTENLRQLRGDMQVPSTMRVMGFEEYIKYKEMEANENH